MVLRSRLDGSMILDTSQPFPRRVLMLAAAFPPTGGAGVQRSVKFAKYLPRVGWLPTVWTVDRIDGLPEDPTLLADLPEDVMVQRSVRAGSLRAWHRRIRNRGSSRFAGALEWRLRRFLSRQPWPDDYVGWARASVQPLVRLIAEQSIDVIYSTFSPASNHLLGLALKRRTGLPWVADFRDLWTDDLRYREPGARRHRANRRLESKILEFADAVVGVTPRQTAILAEHLPDRRRKFVTITNGFDPADFEVKEASRPAAQGKFVLAFVGRFDRRRADDRLLAGLQRFAAEVGTQGDRFVFRVVGHADKVTLGKLRSSGVDHVFTGYRPHAEAIDEMRAADALLISTEATGPNATSVINGKLFEYLASGRPILVVGPEGGECERIVRSCGAGLTVGFDADEIAGALRTLFRAWQQGRPTTGCQPHRLGPYSRITLARNLGSVLDRLVVRNSPATSDETAREEVVAR